MSSDKETSRWNCRICGNEFIPQPPDYNCPKCNSSNTVPNKSSRAMMLLEEKTQMNQAGKPNQKDTRTTDPISALLGTPSHMGYDFTEKLLTHLQSIGVVAKNAKQPKDPGSVEDKGLTAKLREYMDKVPSAAGKIKAVVEVDGRNIDRVEVYETLIMVPKRKGGYKREIAYIHEYVISDDAASLEQTSAKPGMSDSLEGEVLIADTKKVEQKHGLFSKQTVGFQWVNPSLGLLGRRARYEKQDRLVSELNGDKQLNDELFRLDVYRNIGVFLHVGEGRISVNHGVGREVTGFADRETFEAFDRIAGHIKAMKTPAH